MPGEDKSPSAAIALIRTAMIEKKMTQAELADAADCHEKTIQNLLSGRAVRDQTLFDVCMVLGLDFERLRRAGLYARHKSSPDGGLLDGHGESLDGAATRAAPVHMGAYTRAAVDHYIGSYLTLRPSFSVPGGVMAYRTDIAWDDEWPSLVFQERDRPDTGYANRGRLHVSTSSMYVHLVSANKGAMRMVVVSRLDAVGQMFGLITTMHKQKAHLVPVSAPIAYLKREDFAGVQLGEVSAGHIALPGYARVLQDVLDQGYARLIDGD